MISAEAFSEQIARGCSKIGLYMGGGAGYQPTYHAVLTTAAASAFGSGFALTNLTAAAVALLSPEEYDVVVFPGGSGNGPAGQSPLRNPPVACDS